MSEGNTLMRLMMAWVVMSAFVIVLYFVGDQIPGESWIDKNHLHHHEVEVPGVNGTTTQVLVPEEDTTIERELAPKKITGAGDAVKDLGDSKPAATETAAASFVADLSSVDASATVATTETGIKEPKKTVSHVPLKFSRGFDSHSPGEQQQRSASGGGGGMHSNKMKKGGGGLNNKMGGGGGKAGGGGGTVKRASFAPGGGDGGTRGYNFPPGGGGGAKQQPLSGNERHLEETKSSRISPLGKIQQMEREEKMG
jgi:hypothetical protein